MNSTLLCTFHACPMTCSLPECQLLAYVRELERDKARLDWLGQSDLEVGQYGCHPIWANGMGEVDHADFRATLDIAMQAMKEGK